MQKKVAILFALSITSCTIVPKSMNEQTVWKQRVDTYSTASAQTPQVFSYFSHTPREGVECIVIPLPKPQYVAVGVTLALEGENPEMYVSEIRDIQLSVFSQIFAFDRTSNVFEKECATALGQLPKEAWEHFPPHWNIGEMSGVVMDKDIIGKDAHQGAILSIDVTKD